MKKLKYKQLFVSQLVSCKYGVVKIMKIESKNRITVSDMEESLYNIDLNSGLYTLDNKIDPMHLGIPNINFSHKVKKGKRFDEFTQQRLERGFDDSELWNLDDTIAAFILPRLIAFQNTIKGYPGHLSKKKWCNIIDKIVYAFTNYDVNNEDKKVEEGLDLFRKYFNYLWT